MKYLLLTLILFSNDCLSIEQTNLKYELTSEKEWGYLAIGYRLGSGVDIYCRYEYKNIQYVLYRSPNRSEKISKISISAENKTHNLNLKKNISESEFTEFVKADNIRLTMYARTKWKRFRRSPVAKLDSEKLLDLVTQCNLKKKARIDNRAQLYKKRKERISKIADNFGLTPMFGGSNVASFEEIITQISQRGEVNTRGQFVRVQNGFYRVTQVIGKRGAILSSYGFSNQPLIRINTVGPVIQGQDWARTSSLVKFVEVTSATTVLGASRQIIVFDQLSIDTN